MCHICLFFRGTKGEEKKKIYYGRCKSKIYFILSKDQLKAAIIFPLLLQDSILQTVEKVSRSSEVLAGALRNQEQPSSNQYVAFGNMVAARLQTFDASRAERAMANISSVIFAICDN